MKRRVIYVCLLFLVFNVTLSYSQVRLGYFPDWEVGNLSKVDFTKLTEITYFSYNPMNNAGDIPTSSVWFTPANFTAVVNAARTQNPSIRILLTTGGAPGSDNITTRLSTIAASATARSNMANQIIRFIANKNLDGWDLDWEFPATTGSDKANHATLLALMRSKLDSLGLVMCKKLTLSIAVGGETNHLESNPTHADYVNTSAAFIGYLDYVNVMSYDACMSCHPTYTTHSPLAFAQQAITGYSGTTLGTPTYTFNWPKSKLLLGIAFYAQPSGAAYSTINASNSAAIFNSDVSGTYGGYNGCPTIQSKMDWAQSQGLGGVFIWELGQDLITSNTYSLLGCIGSRAVLKAWTVPSFSNPCPLSANIVSLRGQRLGQQVVLNWKTSGERNSARFEIQRSSNGVDFKSVNAVDAVGNTDQGQAYSATDFYPGSGQLYYRLAQYDFDGKMNKSEIINIPATSELAVRIIPNPSEGFANILFDNLSDYNEASIWMTNVEGREVFYKEYVAGEVTAISIGENLPSGIYFVKVVAEGKSTIQKFVKK